VAVIGMILLGFFPNQPETSLMHILAGILSFGGITLAVIFYWIALIHDSIQKALMFHHLGIFMILTLITFSLTAILFIGVIQISSSYFFRDIFWFLDFPFWEWMLFILLSIQLIFIGLIVPERFSSS
jgi:hypothetical protein